jgi:CheY-like chemotaxis protein
MSHELRILVVDDTPVFGVFWEDFLVSVGIPFDVEKNFRDRAQDALSLLHQDPHAFDAVIIDMFMPTGPMQGEGLLDAILNDPRLSHLKLHVWSGTPRGVGKLSEAFCKLREARGATFWYKDPGQRKEIMNAIVRKIKEQCSRRECPQAA